MTDKLQIAIVGAGIGGLFAALALRARGLNVTVFEQADSPPNSVPGFRFTPMPYACCGALGFTIGSRISAPRASVFHCGRRVANPFRRRQPLPIARPTRSIAWNCWKCSMMRKRTRWFAMAIIVPG